jgi:hypothetical protein
MTAAIQATRIKGAVRCIQCADPGRDEKFGNVGFGEGTCFQDCCHTKESLHGTGGNRTVLCRVRLSVSEGQKDKRHPRSPRRHAAITTRTRAFHPYRSQQSHAHVPWPRL